MATSLTQQVYQCDQCGNADIVAVPLLYQQGTRTFSGIFSRGVSQSVAAQTFSPPRPRSYSLRALVWGFSTAVCLLWGSTALRALLRDGARSTALLGVTTIFLIFCVGTLVGMFRSMSKIYRYNHEVFPKLESEWSQSFVCRRCGKLQRIS